ncbi:MAG: nucleotide sugar dehydrogenase [Candidatus Moranbacteria bacterium]|nr:nucleotide sugar dehydrogenase [Candidatus Moranbacteria bacterium]
MKINVVGLGYIGLRTALSLAAGGCSVVGTDQNESLLETLASGEVTFEEKGLPELFARATKSKHLAFSPVCVEADVYIVAVPTPYRKDTKRIDPRFVAAAVEDVLAVCKKGAIIAVESTIAPGTMDACVRPLIERTGLVCGTDVHIAHVPERIIPGNMLFELTHNSRTIGVDESAVGETLKSVYRAFCQGEMVVTSIKTAEMTKVVENTYRDINIAFANELARLCYRGGMDVNEIIRVANMHPRVNILSPGPGVGGHCISVDPWFLVGDYPGLANIVLAARKINDSMPEFVLERIHNIMQENGIKDVSRVGLYGLTYKENVDDVRESPTLQLLTCMKKHLANGIKVYDPFVKKDIVEKILRPVSINNFINDPLRVFRAARFSAVFPDFEVSEELIEAMRIIAKKGLTKNISPERVGNELRKAFSARSPENFIRLLKDTQNLNPWFKEFENADKIPAGPEKFHGKNTVFEHTENCMKKVYGSSLLVWMAFCHDLGKTKTPENILPSHHGHEKTGAKLAETLGKRLRLPLKFINGGIISAKYHMKTGRYNELKPSTRVKLLTELYKKGFFREIFIITQADKGINYLNLAEDDLEIILKTKLPEEKKGLNKKSGEILFQMRCESLTKKNH